MSEYVSKLFGLEGKVAALTGAGGHLVGEMARSLGQAGVKVAALDISIDAADRTAAAVRAAGGDALALATDVRQNTDYEQALAAVLQRWGRLDFAVFGAGANAPTPFAAISLEEWNDILAVQLTGTMLGCQVFGGHMVMQKSGSIVTIA